MIRFRPLINLISFICCVFLYAQELPPIQNFTPVDYNAENQNWGISQAEDKLIYIANNKGLLEYNGANWTLYPSPNETIVRSVTAIGNKIYTGSYMEFGFWEKNILGELKYTSLSNELGLELVQDEEFWKILGIENYVVFQSLDRIYIYNTLNKSINAISSNERIVNVFKVDESIYFQRFEKGIYKIDAGEDRLFLDNKIVRNSEVIDIFPGKNGFVFITRNNGIYNYNDGAFVEWKSSVNNQLRNSSIYSVTRLRNGSIILGTIAGGLVYIDSENDTILFKIDQAKGLLNNTVLSVFEDVDSNIWLGLDNGISFINMNAPFKIYRDEKGNLGSVYTSAIFNNKLYFGTNQGLFFKPLNDGNEFKFINGTEGQVWRLDVINNELFCAHHKGTFVVDDEKVKKVSNVQGTWGVVKLDENSDLLIQGNYDGLYVLKKSNGNWQLKNKIEGFNNSSRYFEVIENSIFVNHEYKGLYQVKVDDLFTKTTNVVLDSSLKGANSGLSRYKETLLYAYRAGVLTYDKAQAKFVKDSILSTIYNKSSYVSGRILPTKEKDEFWLFSKNNLTLVSPGELASLPKFKTIPLTQDERNDVVEYENILKTNNDKEYILGTSSGYIKIHADKVVPKNFAVFINKIVRGVSKGHSSAKHLISKREKGDFRSNENNLSISYYTPEFNKYLKPSYQFQLLGIYDEWSEWTNESTVFFENLPSGEYTFNVRAKIGNNLSVNIASYEFKIAKPWYITNIMIGFYALGVVLFSIFMHNVYKRYYRKEQQKLIEKNRRKLELARAQNEKEIMRIRSEKLEKEFKTKSKELAASTMSIVKKNELLAQVKDRLMRFESGDAIEPLIQVIDKNLNHNDNWEFFKEAFDNADSEFFKTLKDAHPNLSPNDLKLCAYLRLNLSSKEIAPMFNISARSVEIKRYRLRKKMNLSSNENLTNYILSL